MIGMPKYKEKPYKKHGLKKFLPPLKLLYILE